MTRGAQGKARGTPGSHGVPLPWLSPWSPWSSLGPSLTLKQTRNCNLLIPFWKIRDHSLQRKRKGPGDPGEPGAPREELGGARRSQAEPATRRSQVLSGLERPGGPSRP